MTVVVAVAVFLIISSTFLSSATLCVSYSFSYLYIGWVVAIIITGTNPIAIAPQKQQKQ